MFVCLFFICFLFFVYREFDWFTWLKGSQNLILWLNDLILTFGSCCDMYEYVVWQWYSIQCARVSAFDHDASTVGIVLIICFFAILKGSKKNDGCYCALQHWALIQTVWLMFDWNEVNTWMFVSVICVWWIKESILFNHCCQHFL